MQSWWLALSRGLFLDLEGYLVILGVNRQVVEEGIRLDYKYPETMRKSAQGEKFGTLAKKYLEKMSRCRWSCR